MTTSLDDEFTELVDADIPRVDLVDKAANGTRFLIAKQADGAGLLDPAYVRELIGKSEPEPPEETVTMTGSPAAIAKMIHAASLRRESAATSAVQLDLRGSQVLSDEGIAGLADRIGKAVASTADQNDLPDSAFAYIEGGGTKDESGRTVPRTLRHFPINDEAHVRNALSRAPQSPFGDKAMPKIRAAAKKFGIDVAKEALMDDDVLDPMTALAEPEGDAPGMDTDPGSPAWEAVDAATARKWTGILARAKNAIDLLADREMLEAAAGDEDDAENAWDLQDACCALDYAISVLAPFAVAEQAEADCCEDMQTVGKALAGFDTAVLDTIEALGHVRKAGRVLSAGNEAAIRGAVESLQKVLASLPAAPTTEESGPSVAKTANEEPDMPKPTLSEDVTADSGQEPAMGAQQPEPVGKADGEKTPMVVVYDQKGKLIGIVDPSDVTPVANSESDGTTDDTDETDATPEAAPAAAPDASDLTPAPAAEVGTPADAVPDDEAVTKNTTSEEVLKSIVNARVEAALADYRTTQEQKVAQLVDVVEMLKGQVQALEEQPAVPNVFTNGAMPTREQLRGQDRGGLSADVTKAMQRRQSLYQTADAGEQNRIAADMQAEAIARLQEIQRG